MPNYNPLIILIVFIALLSGCANKTEVTPEKTFTQLYTQAQDNLQEKNFCGAIQQLEAINNRYPYGPYLAQVQLDLIYAYYCCAEWVSAKTLIDRFIYLNIEHPDLDYALYIRGLTNVAKHNIPTQNWFKIDGAERATGPLKEAFADFKKLITEYPHSVYSPNAWLYLIAIKNSLARHELAIINHYQQYGAPVAVIKRVEQLLHNYPDTQSMLYALPLMHKAYQKLKLTQLADATQRLMYANPIPQT